MKHKPEISMMFGAGAGRHIAGYKIRLFTGKYSKTQIGL